MIRDSNRAWTYRIPECQECCEAAYARGCDKHPSNVNGLSEYAGGYSEARDLGVVGYGLS